MANTSTKKSLLKHKLSKEDLEKFEAQIEETNAYLPELEVPEKKSHRLTKDEKEARLNLIQRMIFRNIPKKEIAKQLGVTPRHLSRMVKDLEEYTVSEVKKMDFPQFVGNTLTFYDEIRGMSLMMASEKTTTKKERLQAMQVALRAESEKHNFFALCGIYKSPHAIAEARRMIAPDSTIEGQDVTELITGLAKHLLTVNPKEVKDYHIEDKTKVIEAEEVLDTNA